MPSDTIYHHRAHSVARVAFTLAALASSLLSSCRGADALVHDDWAGEIRRVEHLELASPRGSVSPGETLLMAVKATDHSGLPIVSPALEWSSASPAVATVDRIGLVRGVMPGTSRILVSAGAVAASIEITVCVSSGALHIAGPSAVVPGRSAAFTLELPHGACVAEAAVTGETVATAWSTSDPTIATIDAAGVLSALRVGKVTVSATRLGVTLAAQVVVTTSPGQIAFVEGGTLMLMPADGAPSPILQRDGSPISTSSAALSPDGRTVAFDCLAGICLTPVTGGVTPLAFFEGKSPSWGAHGLAIAAWTDYVAIAIADVASGRVDRVRTPRYAQRPRSSPDGTEVAFECDYWNPYDALSDVCIMSVNNGALLAVIRDASTVAWSPDGARLAYVHDGLCVAPRSDPGRCTTIIGPQSGDGVIEAAWSPDGYRLVVARAGGLWITASDGTGLTEILSSAKGISSPSWGATP